MRRRRDRAPKRKPANGGHLTPVEEISATARLRGGGCSRHRTRLRPQFPANREINREFCKSGLARRFSRADSQLIQWFAAKFPMQRNREFFEHNREFSAKKQGCWISNLEQLRRLAASWAFAGRGRLLQHVGRLWPSCAPPWPRAPPLFWRPAQLPFWPRAPLPVWPRARLPSSPYSPRQGFSSSPGPSSRLVDTPNRPTRHRRPAARPSARR